MTDASKDPLLAFPVAAAELEIAFGGPSILSNRFIAINTAAGLRIAFCENSGQPEGPLYFRTAVVLSYADALALRNLITSQLQSIGIDLPITTVPNKDG